MIVVVVGGTVIDQLGRRPADVLVRDGNIAQVAPAVQAPPGSLQLEADGCVISPGLVDLHTHLRQPGREEAETIESGTRAAALGGYTAVVAMPNTEPAVDTAAAVREIQELAAASASCQVGVAGAITADRAGQRLAPIAEMAELGVQLFTDDGSGVQDGALMRRALDYGRGLGVILAEHCEDAALANGAMHEGAWSSRLGLPGIPSAAEEVMLARDISLVRTTGAPMHFLHLSTAGSAELLCRAKAEGLPVTAEVTPHHLSLTDAAVREYDPVFKVNPPLRTDDDVKALRQALVQGTVDAVATDHAPHTSEMKELPFAEAPPGMLGLETALAVTLSAMGATETSRPAMSWPGAVQPGDGATLTVDEVLAKLSWEPARIARLDDRQGGPLTPGRPANLCVFDPGEVWEVDRAELASRSHNSPFVGWRIAGRVRHTVFDGVPTVIDGKAQR